jgi:hypothetical protein
MGCCCWKLQRKLLGWEASETSTCTSGVSDVVSGIHAVCIGRFVLAVQIELI